MAAEMTIDVTKTFSGRAPIQARLRYAVEASTVLILFGPSGAGKTTILRSVAGLEWPEDGRIQFVSRTWLDTRSGIRVSPQDRHIGYMPQDYALFPAPAYALRRSAQARRPRAGPDPRSQDSPDGRAVRSARRPDPADHGQSAAGTVERR